MMLEKAAKECLWAKPNDSWGTVCGIYQVSQGAGEKHGNKKGWSEMSKEARGRLVLTTKGHEL